MSRTNSEVEGGPESLPAHSSASHAYTRGVEVLQANISGPGELSLWEFSGQESYFSLYDHFIGKYEVRASKGCNSMIIKAKNTIIPLFFNECRWYASLYCTVNRFL
jgi:hypothetical protein